MEDMEWQASDTIEVSIIVPVYNVVNWFDKCMESVVSQSFVAFEVILVDDGSTDGSSELCDKWSEKDSRIRVLHKKNEGPSVARNKGIQVSRGNYLTFLDSDDWFAPCFLEKLHYAIVSQKADMAECDVWRVDRTGNKTLRKTAGIMGKEYSLHEQMEYGYTAVWKCMFRRELFTDYHLQFPDCHSEARAIYPLLLCLSRNRVYVPEPLYYYRLYREGSLSLVPRKKRERRAEGTEAYACLLNSFREYGLYRQYEKILQKLTVVKLSDLLASFFTQRQSREFAELVKEYRQFINGCFPELPIVNYLNVSGYNLNRILGNMCILHDPSGRFNFSSLVSIMHPVQGECVICHKNQYRQIMVEREVKNVFWTLMRERKPDAVFLDFIEERFDLVAYQGGYLTRSDAFEGCGIEPKPELGIVISRDSAVCAQLWQDSAFAFIRRMETEYPDTDIIVVQNYLAEQVGDIFIQEEFPNVEEIRKINRILEEYYQFFREHCRKAKVVYASKCSYYFTDRQYEYGAVPSHLNDLVNRDIAEKIEECIGV